MFCLNKCVFDIVKTLLACLQSDFFSREVGSESAQI